MAKDVGTKGMANNVVTGFIVVLVCCLGMLAININILYSKSSAMGHVSLDHVTGTSSLLVPASVLSGCRILAFAIISGTNFQVAFGPPIDLTGTTRRGEMKKVSVSGPHRFCTFTVWCWCLQWIYFVLALACTFLPLEVLDAWAPLSSVLPQVLWIIFEISASMSVLVTIIVTWVLYPTSVKRGVSTEWAFRWPSLFMHNLNLVFMMTELILNNFPTVNPWHAPYAFFYGLAYVLFAWTLEACGGVFFYFFLNYSHKYAVLFYFGLFTALYVFFFQLWLLKTAILVSPAGGVFAIACFMSQVLMFRPYKVQTKGSQ